MIRFRSIAFLCTASLLTLGVASWEGSPVAASGSDQAVLSARLLTLLSVAGSQHLALQAAAGAPPAKSDDPLPDGNGKDLTKKLCGKCHALAIVTQKRHTSDEWDAILVAMLAKGLEASDDDMDTVHDYLVTYFGPVKAGSTEASPDAPSNH